MSNTNQDSHKGKEKVNEESVTNSQTMENPNKRKRIALKEEPDAETKNSKSPRNNANAGVDESTSSSKEFSPFLLFGFIIDPSKGYQKAYSCAFCRRKFVSSQALSGKQNCQECEESLRRVVEALNKPRDNLYYGVQGMRLSKIVPYTGGCGYVYGGNDAGKLQGPVLHNAQIDQNTVNGQVIRAEIDLNNDLVSEEASKNIDLNLMP